VRVPSGLIRSANFSWDILKIVVGENKNSNVSFHLRRQLRPVKELSDAFQSTWVNMVEGSPLQRE